MRNRLLFLTLVAAGLPIIGISSHVESTDLTAGISHKQYIKCVDGKDEIKATLHLNGKEIVESHIEYHGPNLAPGLYSGQSIAGDTYNYSESKKEMALIGSGYNVSSDDPVLFRLSFSKSIIGKGFKKNTIEVFFSQREGNNYHTGDLEEFYEELKEEGEFDSSVEESSDGPQEGCWTYTKKVGVSLKDSNFADLRSSSLRSFGGKLYGTYLETFGDESDGYAFRVNEKVSSADEWKKVIEQVLTETNKSNVNLSVSFQKISKKKLTPKDFYDSLGYSKNPDDKELTKFIKSMIARVKSHRSLDFYTASSSSESYTLDGFVILHKKTRELIWLHSISGN